MTDPRESEAREVLAPCPFCGGEGGFTGTNMWRAGLQVRLVTCRDCGSCGRDDIWNTRAPSTPVQSAADDLEAMREACAKVADRERTNRYAARDNALERKKKFEARDHESMAIAAVHIAAAIRAMTLDITKGEDR